MTELKTLKDIEEILVDMEGVGLTMARQEAIKWMKALDKEPEFADKYPFVCSEWGDYGEVISFIKHFFNITEEELRKG